MVVPEGLPPSIWSLRVIEPLFVAERVIVTGDSAVEELVFTKIALGVLPRESSV